MTESQLAQDTRRGLKMTHRKAEEIVMSKKRNYVTIIITLENIEK